MDKLLNTIQRQLQERERFRAASFILREQSTGAETLLDSPLAKVVMGPRRSGKSVFCHQILRNRDYAYVNLDDENLAGKTDHDALINAVNRVYEGLKTVFFDEIQNLERWELLVNRLLREGYNVILTGSNSRLLSSELATALTGRHLPIEVLPFSFNEYLKCTKGLPEDLANPAAIPKTELLPALEKYLLSGGFPEPVVYGLDSGQYLSTLLDSILFKDIVARYHVRYSSQLRELAMTLTSGMSNEYTLQKLVRNLGFSGVATASKYLGYLEESFLFFSLRRFSFRLKEQFKAPRKTYLVDNGLYSASAFRISPGTGRLVENAAFLHLVRSGFRPNIELFSYKTRQGREVDFILRSGIKPVSLIQVAHDISEQKTLERELRSLAEASGEMNVTDDLQLVTWDTEGTESYKGLKIKILPMWKWIGSPVKARA